MLYATFLMNFHQEQTVKRAEMVDGTILHRQEVGVSRKSGKRGRQSCIL